MIGLDGCYVKQVNLDRRHLNILPEYLSQFGVFFSKNPEKLLTSGSFLITI